LSQPTGKARKLSSVVVLIIICVIPIVGLAYLFVPSIPVSNMLTLPVTNTLTLPVTSTLTVTYSGTHSDIYYSTRYVTFTTITVCWAQYRGACGGLEDICIAGLMGYWLCGHPTTSTQTTSSTSTWIGSITSAFASTSQTPFTSTSHTITTTTAILPPSALYQEESKAATIAMIAILVVGLCYLLLLMMKWRKTEQSKPMLSNPT
jgi:hypothetical protein